MKNQVNVVGSEKPVMHYEGEGGETVVYTYKGREWRFDISQIYELTWLFKIPGDVRDSILLWADMLVNPD